MHIAVLGPLIAQATVLVPGESTGGGSGAGPIDNGGAKPRALLALHAGRPATVAERRVVAVEDQALLRIGPGEDTAVAGDLQPFLPTIRCGNRAGRRPFSHWPGPAGGRTR